MQTKEEKKADTEKRRKARERKRKERARKKIQLGISPGRGKPRRAEGLAKKRTVRIDDDTYKLLRQEFGTIGNAVFYLAEGVKQYRKNNKLRPPVPDSRLPESERKPRLSGEDLKALIAVLEDHIRDWCDNRVEMQPYQELINKLEKFL